MITLRGKSEKKKMQIKKALKIMVLHQKWRTGDICDIPCTPHELTLATLAIIEYVERSMKQNKYGTVTTATCRHGGNVV